MIQRHFWPEFRASTEKGFQSPWQPLLLLLKINTCLISWLKSLRVCVVFMGFSMKESPVLSLSFRPFESWHLDALSRFVALRTTTFDRHPNLKKDKLKNQLSLVAMKTVGSRLLVSYLRLRYAEWLYSHRSSRCCLDFACSSLLFFPGDVVDSHSFCSMMASSPGRNSPAFNALAVVSDALASCWPLHATWHWPWHSPLYRVHTGRACGSCPWIFCQGSLVSDAAFPQVSRWETVTCLLFDKGAAATKGRV